MAMIPKTVTKLGPEEASRTIGKVLTRARAFDSPAIIVVEFPSERVRQAAVEALSTYLAGTDNVLVEIDLREQRGLFEAVANLAPNQIASIHGLHAQPELVRRLNWRREFLTENSVRAVFWLNFEELKDLIARAPDFWAFRNRHLVLEPSPQEASYDAEPTYYSFGSPELSNLPAQAKADRIEALEELLEGTDDPKSLRAQAIRDDLGQLLWETGRYSRAVKCYQQALAISREIGDRLREGIWLGNLGNAYSNLGEVQKAIDHYQQALVISREIGDRGGEGNWLGSLGNAYSNLGEVQKAIGYYQQALVISREIGDRLREGIWLGNLGLAYSNLGEVQKAIDHYQQALVISREIGDRLREGIWLGNLGNAYRELGEVEKAMALGVPALILFNDMSLINLHGR
jgi:tetratricopeptide (TPR) repeat protein